MTATPSQPYTPFVPCARAEGGRPPRSRKGRAAGIPYAARDALTLMALPLLVALALPAAFAGGGTRRWFGGRSESQRAEAQAAKDSAAAAFYELDTAQRDLRISIETITAVDASPRPAAPSPTSRRWDGVSTRPARSTSPPSTPTTSTVTTWRRRSPRRPGPSSPAPRTNWAGSSSSWTASSRASNRCSARRRRSSPGSPRPSSAPARPCWPRRTRWTAYGDQGSRPTISPPGSPPSGPS